MNKLNINGNKHPFRLELGGLRLYALKKGLKKVKTKDLPQVMEDADIIEDYPILIWAGLKSGPAPGEERFKETPDTVAKWLEEDPSAFDRAIDMINEDTVVDEGSEGKVPNPAVT